MLEKLGLPPTPAARGSSWVEDASHCQACASHFTFFNRKHHCRRCGGLFCGNCTKHRTFLRGQGEGPVRICDPCKKLSDAARFESRHGQKHRTFRGESKGTSKLEVDLLIKKSACSEDNSQNLSSVSIVENDKGDFDMSQDNECTSSEGTNECSLRETMGMPPKNDESCCNAELLRQQALDEKKKWLTLKKDGKAEEAMLAFKRGKELERQAEAVELSIRRSQRKAGSNASLANREQKHDISMDKRKKKGETSLKEAQESIPDSSVHKQSSRRETEGKHDILSDLKELGWSDTETRDADKKRAKGYTVENELTGLDAGTSLLTSVNKKSEAMSSMQVLAHKRKALALKREGKITEAKEELKKAKIIERQLEEQEVGGGEESDDELAALIRSLDKEKTVLLNSPMHMDSSLDSSIDFTKLPFTLDESGDDSPEISDSDMNDPEMLAALRSIGWEETEALGKTSITSDFEKSNTFSGANTRMGQGQAEMGNSLVHGKKRMMSTSRMYDEGDLKICDQFNDSEISVNVTEEDMEDPYFLSVLHAMGFEDEKPAELMQPIINAALHNPIEKATLQQQILSLKKEALTLKLAGEIDAAKEELRRAKQLEKELQALQVQHLHYENISMQELNVVPDTYFFEPNEEDAMNEVVDVTEEDLVDPEFAKTLKSLGWQDEEIDIGNKKAILQQEILLVKKQALGLKRAGNIDAAKEELHRAKQLEKEFQDLHVKHTHDGNLLSVKKVNVVPDAHGFKHIEEDTRVEAVDITEEHFGDSELTKTVKSLCWQDNDNDLEKNQTEQSIKTFSESLTTRNRNAKSSLQQKKKSEIQRELLGLKRSALKLRRVGKTEEAEQELEKARILEQQMVEFESSDLIIKTDPRKEMVKEETQDLQFIFHDQVRDKTKLRKETIQNADVLTALPQAGWKEEQEKNHLFIDVPKNVEASPKKNELTKGSTVFKQNEEANHTVEPMLVETGREDHVAYFTCKHASEETASLGNFSSKLGGRELPIDSFPSLVPSQCENTHVKGGATALTTGGMQGMDLLTGDEWKSVVPNGECESADGLVGQELRDSSQSHWIDEHPKNEKLSSEQDIAWSERRETTTVGLIEEVPPIMEDKFPIVENKLSTQASVEHDLQQQILAHKRKALSLKREGKQVEAKEELRCAKLLQKKLELNNIPVEEKLIDAVQSSAHVDISMPAVKHDPRVKSSSNVSMVPEKAFESSTSIEKSSSMSNKHVVKDRMKLQQQSLAHKRKALALRREGKIEEAEAETQLAKSIEMQMKEFEGVGTTPSFNDHQSETVQEDGVDDMLDPQLLAALKGLGWKDSDIFINDAVSVKTGAENSHPTGSTSSTKVGRTHKPAVSHSDGRQRKMDERSQLEERIKAEKLHAVQLKNLGKRAEALEVLRGAKTLEKKLDSLTA